MNEGQQKTLNELVDRQYEAAMKVQAKEQELKQAKLEHRNLAENVIPEFMEEAGIQEITTLGGLHVKVDTVIVAGITKERAPEALAWLRENGHAKLIKNKFTVIPNTDQQSQDLTQTLVDMDGLDISRSITVHAGSLKKFVRLELEAGHELPMELLGVFRKRVATVGEK